MMGFLWFCVSLVAIMVTLIGYGLLMIAWDEWRDRDLLSRGQRLRMLALFAFGLGVLFGPTLILVYLVWAA